ncbi:MAG: LutC/YkgG family protein [Pyrinomonadaceae bacterium]
MNISARDSILRSIRSHLAASAPHNAVYSENVPSDLPKETRLPSTEGDGETRSGKAVGSLVEIFKQNLEAVGGHCFVAQSEMEVTEAIARIISELNKSDLRARRLALSNAPAIERWVKAINVDLDEITVTPGVSDLFSYDVGISAAQMAIAETGTILLESEAERHRLVSLVPPVHIAIVNGANIFLTLGEALTEISRPGELSRTITLITGPSRTGDIELTLTIGVHGPLELYVIVNNASATS